MTSTAICRLTAALLIVAGCDGSMEDDAGPSADAEVMGDAGFDGGGSATDAGLDAGASALTEDSYRSSYLAAVCRVQLDCHYKVGPLSSWQLERFCHPAIADGYWDELDHAVSTGAVVFDPQAATDCLARLDAVSCRDFYAPVSPLSDLSCPEAYAPQRSVGESCDTGFECAEGWCDIGAMCPGTCVALASAGAPCSADATCGDGLVCVAGACAPRAAAGGGCARSAECESGLMCDAGTCAARPARGEACALAAGRSECADALVCVSGVCGDGAAEGEACGATPCAEGLRCDVVGTALCVTSSGPGEPCAADANCADYFSCVSGSCAAWPLLGETCSGTLPCVQGACVAGTCARQALGSTCEPPNRFVPFGEQCAEDAWCGDTQQCEARLTEGQSCRSVRACGDGLTCRADGGGATCQPSCSS